MKWEFDNLYTQLVYKGKKKIKTDKGYVYQITPLEKNKWAISNLAFTNNESMAMFFSTTAQKKIKVLLKKANIKIK